MKKLVSVAVCGLAAGAFTLPAAAQGAGGSVEGGAALGTTGVNTPRNVDGPLRPGDNVGVRPGDHATGGNRTGDTQARHDINPEGKQPADTTRRAQTKEDREASTGATSPRSTDSISPKY